MRSLIDRFCDFYLGHYMASALIAGIVFAASLFFATRLTINSNQLDLLPASLPEIEEAKRINEMVGGTGFIILTIKDSRETREDELIREAVHLKVKGDDEASRRIADQALSLQNGNGAGGRSDLARNDLARLKRAADELKERISGLEEVRYVETRSSMAFLRRKILYFIRTDDLKEAFRRIRKKMNEMAERANPFYIDLGQPAYNLDLSDLIRKYTHIGKREIRDDYFLSSDGRMLLVLVKPDFSMNEVERSRLLEHRIQEIIHQMDLERRGIKVGLTGTYVQFADGYDSIHKSLRPTMFLSFLGIAIVLFLFIRRKRIILALLFSLAYAIVVTFGVTYLVVGELNIITAIFGGILAGLGIDFGIQFFFRFREEYWHSGDLRESLKAAIRNTGAAAIYSASTTAAAFAALVSSDFKGFSEFGLISAYGIVITALSMFFLTPLLIVLYSKISPEFLRTMRQDPSERKEEREEYHNRNIPFYSRIVLLVLPFLLVGSVLLARNLKFNRDYRTMVAADLPSELMKHELQIRYRMSMDPMGIASPSIEEASSLWEYLEIYNHNNPWIAQVASLFSFVPPMEQQLENEKLMASLRRETASVPVSAIPAKYRNYWREFNDILGEKPFTYQDLPAELRLPFASVPASRYRGWLTYIYPEVGRLNTTDDLRQIDGMVGTIRYPVVGRWSVERLADLVPAWEKRMGRRFPGSDQKSDSMGMQLSPRETNGVLYIANHISERELAGLGFFPMVERAILRGRPFQRFEDLQSEKHIARTTGPAVLITKFVEIVERESKTILAWTILFVLVILLVSFRNIPSVLIALSPLVVGMTFMLGTMALLGVHMNYFNVIVFPIIIGFGLNNGIFILQRYRETQSVSHALYTTGKAVIASSLTAIVGWGSLAVVQHPGIRSMGQVALIGLIVTMVSSITVTPAVLQMISEGRLPFLRLHPLTDSGRAGDVVPDTVVDARGEKRKRSRKRRGKAEGGA